MRGAETSCRPGCYPGEPALGRMFPPFARLEPLRGYQAEADKPSCLLVTRHTAQAFRAASISEGLAGCRDRDTRAPGQPVKQGGPCGEDTWALGLDDRGSGEASFRAVHGQAGTLGPLLQPPRPLARAPSGLCASPRPPFVQWVHTALLWPGVWPGGSLVSRARAEGAWGHLYWAPLGQRGHGGICTGLPCHQACRPLSRVPDAVSPRGTRVHTQAHVRTCPDSHTPLPREVSSPRATARAPQTEPPLTDQALVPLVVSASEGFLTSGKNL